MPRVLLVDDDEFFLTVEGDQLRSHGYEVVPVISAVEAIAVDWQGIDAVICDLEMPDMNGIEMLRAVRETAGSKAPFLFLTGRSPPEDLIGAAVKYNADYLPKSNDATELLAWLSRCLPRS